MPTEGLAGRMADWIDGFRLADAPEAVRTGARKALINSLGTALGAYTLPDVKIALNTVETEEADGPSSIMVKGTRTSTPLALFANGTMFATLSQEETHIVSGTHPSETTVPLTLTLGERLHSSGEQLLEALVVGIETTVAVASMELTPAVKFDNCAAPAVYGTVGAAAAAAKLLGFDREQIANTLGMGANLTAGLSECVRVGTNEYHFTYGNAGANGYMAAALVRSGAVTAPSVFEGDAGFYQLFGAASRAALAEHDVIGDVCNRLGTDWQITELIYKPYPIYFFNSALVDGAKMIREREGFNPDDIESIRLTIGSLAMASGGPNLPPFRNRDGVLGASAFCVGSMLSRGSLSLKDTQDITAPDILALIDKTVIDDDAGLMTARIMVETSAAEFRFDADSEGRDYRLPESDVKQIFIDAASNSLDGDQCHRILEILENVEDLDDVGKIIGATMAVPARG